MKKIFCIALILSLFLLCACQNGRHKETEPSFAPTESGALTTDPTEQATIDWETPIDVDDSFAEETTPVTETPTEPETSNGETKPTDPSVKPTEPSNPTEGPAEPTEAPTEAPGNNTEPVPTKPSGSGPIELPFISG